MGSMGNLEKSKNETVVKINKCTYYRNTIEIIIPKITYKLNGVSFFNKDGN